MNNWTTPLSDFEKGFFSALLIVGIIWIIAYVR